MNYVDCAPLIAKKKKHISSKKKDEKYNYKIKYRLV